MVVVIFWLEVNVGALLLMAIQLCTRMAEKKGKNDRRWSTGYPMDKRRTLIVKKEGSHGRKNLSR